MGIVRLDPSEVHQIAPLFAGWQESVIWSCLQGVMGEAWADNKTDPKSARIILGDFCYLAGEVDRALITEKPKERASDFIIMVPESAGSESWSKEIESVYQKRCKRVERYAIKKEPGIFDRDHLVQITEGLLEGYEMKRIDEALFWQTREAGWAKDFTAQFHSYEDYRDRGLGVAVCKNGELVSAASSYSVYKGGIEVEIATRADHRRKGLALACGARLVLECMDLGLYPSWDAQNMWSVAIAKKLGYHFDKAYTAYEVSAFGA